MLKFPANAQPVFSSMSYASPAMVPHALGTIGYDRTGRRFRFALCGPSAALVVGNTLQSIAQATEFQDMTPAAAAIGDKSITVTPGAATAAADLYADGIAVIDTTPGLGYSYPIKTHLAVTSSTAFVVQLMPGWSVQVALTAANSRVSLYPNPYRNVIQSPASTLTGVIVGVCQFILAASEYGWIGDQGQFGTLIQGTPSVGEMVSCPGSAAGAVNDYAAGDEQIVGVMMDTGQNGKVEAVKWGL